MKTIRTLGLWVLLATAAGLTGGCGKDSETPKYRTLKGRITSVDLETGEVTMHYYNEKRKKYMDLDGKLGPEAEIFIDGATARLADLQVDDRVVVDIRIEKQGGERRSVPVKVVVDRQKRLLPGASTQPAGQENPLPK